VIGENVLAVEVHQAASTDSDVVFASRLMAFAALDQSSVIVSGAAVSHVSEGAPLVLERGVVGSLPVTLQWFKDGVRLSGQTNRVLSIPSAQLADSGDYVLSASNRFGVALADVNSVSVLPDTNAPTISRVYAQRGNVVVEFSEPVSYSATNISNYALSPDLPVLGAQWLSSTQVVLLTTGLDPQFRYTLSVSNVTDRAAAPNHLMASSHRVAPDWLPATGLLRVETVFLIVMENQGWEMIKGNSAAPYLNSLLSWAASAENYIEPNSSAQNYIRLVAGHDFLVGDLADPDTSQVNSTNHLAGLLTASGVEWRGYMESMPANSDMRSHFPSYIARHNPFAYFTDVTSDTNYARHHVRPYERFASDLTSGSIGRFNFIVPNLTNGMHTGGGGSSLVAQGDSWLARELPRILNSAAYSNNGTVFITWDENTTSVNPTVGMIVLSPLAKRGHASWLPYNHASTLRTMQEIFGLDAELGEAAHAEALHDLFVGVTLEKRLANGVLHVEANHLLPGRTNYVQVSSNLVNWSTIQTNLATNSFSFDWPRPADATHQFFRVIQR
jgi:phosphatidylinositol-3-phosphatase